MKPSHIIFSVLLSGLSLFPSFKSGAFEPGIPRDKPVEITAVGIGIDPISAEKDARRRAVEQAMGVYVQSVTQVENYQVIRDRIETRSTGFIKSMEIIRPLEKQGDEYTLTARFLITREAHQALKDSAQALGLQLQAAGNPDTAVIVQHAEGYDPLTLADLVQGYLAAHGFYYINLAEALRNAHDDNQRYIADYMRQHPGQRMVQVRYREQQQGLFRENIYTVPEAIANKILLDTAKAGKTYYVLFVRLRELSPQEASLTVDIWQTATAKGEGTATVRVPLVQGRASGAQLEKALQQVMQAPQTGVLPLMMKYLQQREQRGENMTLILENYSVVCGKQMRQYLGSKNASYRTKSMGGGQAVYTVWIADRAEFQTELEDFDFIADDKQSKAVSFQENRVIVYCK
jgi:hypothetical protein